MTKSVIDAVNEFEGVWAKVKYTCEQLGEEVALESLGKDSEFPNERYGFITRGITGFSESKYRSVCNEKEFNQCVDEMSKAEWIKPVTPIYKPELGESFLVGTLESDSRIKDFQNEEVEVIGLSVTDTHQHVITFQHPLIGIGCGVYYPSWVKPLTPPIELIDGKAYQFESTQHGGAIGFYNSDSCRFINVNMSIRSDMCTNIQLLEVSK